MRLQRAAILRFTKENILQKRQPQVTCTATTQATEKFFVAKIHRFALSIVDRRTILEKRVSIGYDDRIDCMCIQLIQRQFILLRFFYSILSIYERACACKTKKTKSTTIFTTKSKRSLEEIKNSNNVNITNAPRTYKHAQTVFEINKFFFACRFLGWIRLQCVFPNYWLVYFIILLRFFFFCFILIHSFSVFPLINSN